MNQIEMTPRAIVALLLAVSSLAGGCVAQQEYDEANTAARDLESQLQSCLLDQEDLEASVSLLRTQVSQKDEALRLKDQQISKLSSRLGELDEMAGDLATTVRLMPSSLIDPSTDRALRSFASRYAGMVEYDQQLGSLRFKSDLTFASGSATVRDQAKAGLQALAGILTSPEGSLYDLRVVGHTDSQVISNPATKAKFQNNRVLSMFRAYGVSEALQGYGVPASRIETSGWGQYRPLVPNSPSGGTAPNRRVEIQLTPASSGSAGGASPAGVGGASPAASGASDRFPIK